MGFGLSLDPVQEEERESHKLFVKNSCCSIRSSDTVAIRAYSCSWHSDPCMMLSLKKKKKKKTSGFVLSCALQ